jgi:hypothetical protein
MYIDSFLLTKFAVEINILQFLICFPENKSLEQLYLLFVS